MLNFDKAKEKEAKPEDASAPTQISDIGLKIDQYSKKNAMKVSFVPFFWL